MLHFYTLTENSVHNRLYGQKIMSRNISHTFFPSVLHCSINIFIVLVFLQICAISIMNVSNRHKLGKNNVQLWCRLARKIFFCQFELSAYNYYFLVYDFCPLVRIWPAKNVKVWTFRKYMYIASHRRLVALLGNITYNKSVLFLSDCKNKNSRRKN